MRPDFLVTDRKNPSRRRAAALLLMFATGLIAAAPCRASDVERGKAAVQKHACASCHGADFNSPIDPSYPRLAGQHSDYIAQALKAYRHPDGKLEGRKNPMMLGMAGQLTPAEISDIAAYLGSLPGTLVTRR